MLRWNQLLRSSHHQDAPAFTPQGLPTTAHGSLFHGSRVRAASAACWKSAAGMRTVPKPNISTLKYEWVIFGADPGPSGIVTSTALAGLAALSSAGVSIRKASAGVHRPLLPVKVSVLASASSETPGGEASEATAWKTTMRLLVSTESVLPLTNWRL